MNFLYLGGFTGIIGKVKVNINLFTVIRSEIICLLGMFNTVQCDESDNCWCVDTVTGNEFYGTKTKLFNSAFNICASK